MNAIDIIRMRESLATGLSGLSFIAGEGAFLECAAGFVEITSFANGEWCSLRVRIEAFGAAETSDQWCIEQAKEACRRVIAKGEANQRESALLHLARLESASIPAGATGDMRVNLCHVKPPSKQAFEEPAMSRMTLWEPSVPAEPILVQRAWGVTDRWGRVEFKDLARSERFVLEVVAGIRFAFWRTSGWAADTASDPAQTQTVEGVTITMSDVEDQVLFELSTDAGRVPWGFARYELEHKPGSRLVHMRLSPDGSKRNGQVWVDREEVKTATMKTANIRWLEGVTPENLGNDRQELLSLLATLNDSEVELKWRASL